ncbi:hypothetical protein Z517_09198 [Fonsecaea pedrosoi CBS 271.37]|uniref:Unplaced genomic scaffold supercont1.6, whole genome shotgun sequence n=1 Tax=Fonsecaea pedrosoi CBS 271.37 TaxID=1442368 RepID=A0A0D2GWL5_9EURO|nr:uncharacterized protein Z517_09198 [Fonsecaea pedrosoi CBS 271.37]KIW76754.1 hypothetical protein Z517_09198 [Fonsecaea pedrosoi CBS 271.37]
MASFTGFDLNPLQAPAFVELQDAWNFMLTTLAENKPIVVATNFFEDNDLMSLVVKLRDLHGMKINVCPFPQQPGNANFRRADSTSAVTDPVYGCTIIHCSKETMMNVLRIINDNARTIKKENND